MAVLYYKYNAVQYLGFFGGGGSFFVAAHVFLGPFGSH